MRRVAAIIASLLSLAPALADPPPLLTQAARLPETVDVVFAIDDAEAQRSSPAGKALETFLTNTGALRHAQGPWNGLARLLEFDKDTFKRLFGTRVWIVGESREGRWAVISVIDEQTRDRLRAALKPAPRRLVGKLPVMAVENGRFELALAPIKGDKRWMLVLAKTEHRRLLDGIAGDLINPKADGKLGQVPEFMLAERNLGAGDAFLMIRVHADPKGEPARPAGVIAFRADAVAGGWDMQLLATRGVVFQDLDNLSTFSALTADDLLSGALLGCAAGGPMRDSGFALPGGGVEGGPMDALLEPLRDSTGPRTAVGIVPDNHRPHAISVWMLADTTDRDAASRSGDAMLAALLSEPGSPGPEFNGLFPDAVRTAHLPQRFLAPFGVQNGVAAEEAFCAWGTPMLDKQRSLWIVSAGERPDARIEVLTERLRLDPGDAGARVLFALEVRPSEVAAWLAAAGLDPAGASLLLDPIDLIRLRLFDDDGARHVPGECQIRMNIR